MVNLGSLATTALACVAIAVEDSTSDSCPQVRTHVSLVAIEAHLDNGLVSLVVWFE